MDSELDPRFDPVFQRGHEDDAPSRLEPVSRTEPVETPPASNRRHNPWLPILWILSLALLAFGIWAEWYSQKLMMTPNLDNVAEYYIVPNVLSSLAPWFVAVGLAALVGVVFLHAVRWRDR